MVPVCAIVETLACVLYGSCSPRSPGACLHSVLDDQGVVLKRARGYRLAKLIEGQFCAQSSKPVRMVELS